MIGPRNDILKYSVFPRMLTGKLSYGLDGNTSIMIDIVGVLECRVY